MRNAPRAEAGRVRSYRCFYLGVKRNFGKSENSLFVVPAKPTGRANARPMTGSARAGTHTPRLRFSARWQTAFSPLPLAGEADARSAAGGGSLSARAVRFADAPPPQPSPASGRGAHFRCGALSVVTTTLGFTPSNALPSTLRLQRQRLHSTARKGRENARSTTHGLSKRLLLASLALRCDGPGPYF